MADPANETMVIRCGCGANMRVRASAAGKKAKCPKCGGIVAIPAATSSAPAAVVVKKAAAPTVTAAAPTSLDDLLQMEASTAAEQAATGNRCPQCKVLMGPGAKICISCGYNVETGKSLKTSDGTPGKVAVTAKTLGTFAIGTALSGVGAAIGGLVWFLVAWYANLSVGYIAWGIGVLAGLGMRIGYREGESKAGVVAAGLSALGIVGAKAVIFSLILYTLVTGDTDDIQAMQAFVTFSIANEQMEEEGITSDQEREKRWPKVFKDAEKRVKAMSDEALKVAAAEYREKAEERLSKADESDEGEALAASPENSPGPAEKGDGESSDEPSGGFASLAGFFFKSMFGPFDLLWFFLALSTAYKIGSGAAVKET